MTPFGFPGCGITRIKEKYAVGAAKAIARIQMNNMTAPVVVRIEERKEYRPLPLP